MLKRLTFLASLTVASIIGLPALAADAPTADTVVARVNGEEITMGHLIIAHATLPTQYQQLPADVLYTAILDQLIQQTALTQSLSGEEPRRIRLSLENERRSLLAAEAIEGFLSGAITEADVQAAYDEKYSEGFGGDEYDAAHILVETEDEAKAIIEALNGGADFAEQAREKSTGPSGPNGGALGWFASGQMVPEFEAAVVALSPGQVSDPVKTQFGWHVILLNETRKVQAPALDDVREELTSELQRAAVDAKVTELTAASTVERPEIEDLDPEIVKNLDLVRN